MTDELIRIDGSQGEGGGQVLRTAVTLAIICGKGLQIDNIRSKRKKPGLMAQHLKAIDAAAAISGASVEGAKLNATQIKFYPQKLRSGRYRIEIGTAGATSLIFQTIFLPLSLAESASSITISGGTHVPWSPCYHYLELHWLPFLLQIGFDAQLALDQAGFYPPGGGQISATIRPAVSVGAFHLVERGELISIKGISAVANLDRSIAERQKRQAMQRLGTYSWLGNQGDIKIKNLMLKSHVKGTFLLLLAEFENGRCCYFGLGEKGKPAEQVADEAVDSLVEFTKTDGAVDEYLADQLLLPLAISNGESMIHTSKVTHHLLTNAMIINQFSLAEIRISGELGEPGFVHIKPTK